MSEDVNRCGLRRRSGSIGRIKRKRRTNAQIDALCGDTNDAVCKDVRMHGNANDAVCKGIRMYGDANDAMCKGV